MKRYLLIACLFSQVLLPSRAADIDSLLVVLDRTISMRDVYQSRRDSVISSLKEELAYAGTDMRRFEVNSRIAAEYESYKCDSMLRYIDENMRIAERMRDKESMDATKLALGRYYTFSGMFNDAEDLFESIDFSSLSPGLRLRYCWDNIKLYDNLIVYSDEGPYAEKNREARDRFRNLAISMMSPGSDMYLKESIMRSIDTGNIDSLRMQMPELIRIFNGTVPDTHDYAMMAMMVATAYGALDDQASQSEYLAMSSIVDIRLAVKENEALFALARNLYQDGEIDKAYHYMKYAMDDADFYNSRYKHLIVSKYFSEIEQSYIDELARQKKELRIYAISLMVLLVVLSVSFSFLYKLNRKLNSARRIANASNRKLKSLTKRLNEANVLKDTYMSYFMNQCAVLINRSEETKKDILRKVKSGQIDLLYRSLSRTYEKELSELYESFDKAFLDVYPDFIDELNKLLRPEERYSVGGKTLSPELRIFALIRLGITDIRQIADFLHYSPQTIYNYKSKVRSKSDMDYNAFEEKVRHIGKLNID